MSDVPELDRLLEEHFVFKTNMQWHKTECQMVWWLRVTLAAMFAIIFCVVSIWLGLVAFVAAFKALQLIIPQPRLGDPFKRYRRM